MNVLRHLRYCRADTPFFDLPHGRTGGPAYRDVLPPTPDGWDAGGNGEWASLTPRAAELPAQGWKVHVSASVADAEEILRRTRDYCVEHHLPFKFLTSPEVLVRRSSKYGERSSSGKFVTIYPADEHELENLLRDLGERLRGLHGPYILSDLRWEDGPLYVRYGGFKAITRRNDRGQVEYLITDPDGQLVEDHRGPSFRPPPWVPIPAVLGPALEARAAGRLRDFPYRVTKALHFSNGGGVYLGTDTRDGREVLLREARPLAGLDAHGDDAVTRLEHERWALEQLAGVPGIPELVDHRPGNEHQFLVREYVDGMPLSHASLRRNPVLRGDRSPAALADFVAWSQHVLDQVEAAVTGIHARGVTYGDLHPGNVLVADDGTVRLIDFETATPSADQAVQGIGAAGFMAPPGYVGPAVDRYALGVLRLAVFVPFGNTLTWGREKLAETIDLVTATFPVGDGFRESVLRDLGPAPHEGPSALGGTAERQPWPTPAEDTWPACRDLLAGGILAAADLERLDRLYPGDAEQFYVPGGGVNVATGAAGVIGALGRVDVAVPGEHLDWLDAAVVRLLQSPQPVSAGLLDGFAGMASVLARVGRADRAAELLRRVDQTPVDDVGLDLYGGLAGIGLAHLGLADLTGEEEAVAGAVAVGDIVAQRVADSGRGVLRPGLVHGRSGVSLFWTRLYERTGDAAHVARAEEALRADLADFGWDPTAPQVLQTRPPFLAGGTGGVLLALLELLRHRPTPELEDARDALARTVVSSFAVQAGLFHGRAGIVLALHRLAEDAEGALADDARAALREHLGAFGRNLVSLGGLPVVLGHEALRLSTDLATGSAGVLLALGTCR